MQVMGAMMMMEDQVRNLYLQYGFSKVAPLCITSNTLKAQKNFCIDLTVALLFHLGLDDMYAAFALRCL